MPDKSTVDGSATPARPPVVTPTDEWLARISGQLEDLQQSLRPPVPLEKTSARKRAEVTGT